MELGWRYKGGPSPSPRCLLSIYQHTTSYLQLNFSTSQCISWGWPQHTALLCTYKAPVNVEWMKDTYWVFQFLIALWQTLPNLMVKQLPFYYSQGLCGPGNQISQSRDGLSCTMIWEQLMGRVDSNAELGWDHWPEHWHTASPLHVVLAS